MISNKQYTSIPKIILISIVSIVLSLVIDFQQMKSEFKQDVISVNRLFTQQISSLDTVLTSLAGLHHASDELNHAELSSFSEEMLKAYPYIHDIIAMEKIRTDEIHLFEERMHKEGFISLQFKKTNGISNVPSDDFYLPINFIEPMSPVSAKLLGLDVRSLPDMSSVIDYAISTGNVSASKISIINPSKETAVLMFKALYLGRYPPETKKERYSMLDGLVALKINTDYFMKYLSLKTFNLKGMINNAEKQNSNQSTTNFFEYDFYTNTLNFSEQINIYGQSYQFSLSRQINIGMLNKWQILIFWLMSMMLLYIIFITLKKRKISEDKIRYLAYYDSLTNLPNRESFKQHVTLAIKESIQNNTSGAILFLDLDEFKRINDTLGHALGDELLIQVSRRLIQNMRPTNSRSIEHNTKIKDSITRLGGDEFTVLLTNIKDAIVAGNVARRIQQNISRPFSLNDHEVYITSSIGIALFPQDGDTVDQILKYADTAMYQAKDFGKNNYQFYSKQMSSKVEQRLKLEVKLRQAIKKNELKLYYQPQIETETNEIVAAEALIRWEQSELGLIFPDEFIPLAEDTGQIFKIGEWVLYEACRQNKAWQDAGYKPIRVAVNLSGKQFTQNDLSKTIKNILESTELQAKYLELEITESIMMRNMDETISTIHEFNEMNIGVSIDDFGTGYSSLSYLKKFPIESLKVDKSFVSDIPEDNDDMMITSAIISMAKSLDIKVVAEGVEKQGQIDFLKNQKCDFMQGYYFSKPVPAEEFENLLKKST